MANTEAGIAATSDFKHSISLERGSVNHAISRKGMIYLATAQPRGFAVISTQGSGKVVAQFEERRILGGMFSGDGEAIYAPLQSNKLFLLQAGESKELLADQREELFGVKDVALIGEHLLVVSHNGLHIFNRTTLEPVASFKNEGKSVSPINFLFDHEANLLYIANLRDDQDRNSIVLATDPSDGFKTLWKIRLDGNFSASAGEYPVGKLLQAAGRLVLPVMQSDSRKHRIEFRDPATGEETGRIDVASSRYLSADENLVYIGKLRPDAAAAIDPLTATPLWTAEVDSSVRGPFRKWKGKLYLSGPKKGTTVIDAGNGEVEEVAGRLNFSGVVGGDGVYLVNGNSICWD